MNEPPPRKSPRSILFAALLSFLVGILGLALTALWFFVATLPDMTHPIDEFNANVDHRFEVPDSSTRYVVSVVVPDPSTPVPESQVRFTTAEGEPVETEIIEGWTSLMGHTYRRVFEFDPGDEREFDIHIASGPNEHYAVFRHHSDVLEGTSGRAVMGAVISVLFLIGGVVGLLVFFVKSADQTELEAHP